MKIDLKSLSRKELEKLRGDIDKALVRITKQERKLAIEAAQKAAAAHGFSLSELTKPVEKAAKTPRKAAKAPKAAASAPKFANPADPSQTWTGKGRQPAWFKDAVAAGANPDSMAI